MEKGTMHCAAREICILACKKRNKNMVYISPPNREVILVKIREDIPSRYTYMLFFPTEPFVNTIQTERNEHKVMY